MFKLILNFKMTNNIKIFKLSIGHGFKYVSRGNFL